MPMGLRRPADLDPGFAFAARPRRACVVELASERQDDRAARTCAVAV